VKQPQKVLKQATAGDCSLTSKYDWDSRVAYAVCMAESNGNPLAYGDGGTKYPSIGLMQIRTLPGRPSIEQLYNPEFNMQFAYNMWKNQGFNPWSAYKSGAYKKFLS